MIEQIALKRGHEIVAKIDVDTTAIDFTKMDVAIDFSMPDAALTILNNVLKIMFRLFRELRDG